MARAKRTERAEARRRYRAYLQAQTEAEAEAEADAGGEPAAEEQAAPEKPSRLPRRAWKSPPPTYKGRWLQPVALPKPSGMVSAFRNAFLPIDLLGDIKLLPALVMRSHAIWPVALAVAAGIGIDALNRGNAQVTGTVIALVDPRLFLGALVAGFLAPRAAWLAGALGNFIAGLGYLAIVQMHLSTTTTTEVSSALTSILVLSLSYGVLFGAFAGYYKRFLKLSSFYGASMGDQQNRAKARAARQRAAARRR